MKKSRLLGAVCGFITLFATNVIAADKFWICGNDSWNNGSCWNPTGQPLALDDVFLTQNDNLDRVVTYVNTLNPSESLNSITVDSTGSGTMTLLQMQDSLSYGRLDIGLNGHGVFDQRGGTVTDDSNLNFGFPVISIGGTSTGNGIYNLNNGSLGFEYLGLGHNLDMQAGGQFIDGGSGALNISGGSAYGFILNIGGILGTGQINLTGNGYLYVSETNVSNNSFINQTGGDANFNGYLSVRGTYNFNGGNIIANEVWITSSGLFNHVAGNLSSGSILLNSGGIYNLSGNASLTGGLSSPFHDDVIGKNGDGTFNQSGGTYTTTKLSLGGGFDFFPPPGGDPGSNGNGTYNLNGGSLTAQNEAIGYNSIGTFNQDGGVHTVNNTLILAELVNSKGTYNLDNGTLNVGSLVRGAGISTFNFNNGTLNLTNDNLTIGSGGFFGDTLQLTSTQIINVSLDTVIDSDGLLVVNNGALTSSNYTNNGEILLTNPIARLKGGNLDNDGLVHGDGRIEPTLTNIASGEIRVQAGNRLLFTGAGNTNTGDINLLGGTAEFTQDLTNASGGVIVGRGTLIANGGLTNQGNVAFSDTTDLIGDVNNDTGGSIIISGSSTATFHDDVTHNGTEIRVSSGSQAVFFGAVSGAGPYTGTGSVFFEGDLNPGNSPGLFSVEGDMGLGLSSHTIMEIAGLGRGTEYDAFDIGADLWLGGKLEVSLYDPGTGLFEPQLGDSFDLFLADTISGDFDLLTLSALGGGLDWQLEVLADAIGLTDVVRLSVVTSAVPVPPSVWLFTSGLLGIIAVARRRQRH